MTTRRRNKALMNRNRSSSLDNENEDAGSSLECSNEMDDDDDVSQILMPNGDQKKDKNYANQYDEACAKL